MTALALILVQVVTNYVQSPTPSPGTLMGIPGH